VKHLHFPTKLDGLYFVSARLHLDAVRHHTCSSSPSTALPLSVSAATNHSRNRCAHFHVLSFAPQFDASSNVRLLISPSPNERHAISRASKTPPGNRVITSSRSVFVALGRRGSERVSSEPPGCGASSGLPRAIRASPTQGARSEQDFTHTNQEMMIVPRV
jgi:hypothetical protein